MWPLEHVLKDRCGSMRRKVVSAGSYFVDDLLALGAVSGVRTGPALTPGQPTAVGDGRSEFPCSSRTVINRTICSRSGADGRPMPGLYP